MFPSVGLGRGGSFLSDWDSLSRKVHSILSSMCPIASPARSQILHAKMLTTTIGAFPIPVDASVARRWIHSSSHNPP